MDLNPLLKTKKALTFSEFSGSDQSLAGYRVDSSGCTIVGFQIYSHHKKTCREFIYKIFYSLEFIIFLKFLKIYFIKNNILKTGLFF